MCNAALGMAAFQMAGAALQIRLQNQLAGAQASALASGAVAEANTNYALLTGQQSEVSAKASQDVSLKVRQALRARAMIRVAQAESGVTTRGDRDVSTVMTQAAEDIGTIETNRDAAIGSIQVQKLSVQRGAQVNIERANELIDSRTPPWLAALQMASAGISGYAQGRSAFGPSSGAPRGSPTGTNVGAAGGINPGVNAGRYKSKLLIGGKYAG